MDWAVVVHVEAMDVFGLIGYVRTMVRRGLVWMVELGVIWLDSGWRFSC